MNYTLEILKWLWMRWKQFRMIQKLKKRKGSKL